MYYLYILYSKTKDKYYIGSIGNLSQRFFQHNSGYSKSTKYGIPWELIYSEEYQSRAEAVRRENEIKKMKSRKYIENILLRERPD